MRNKEIKRDRIKYCFDHYGFGWIFIRFAYRFGMLSDIKLYEFKYVHLKKYYGRMTAKYGWESVIETEVKKYFRLYAPNEGGLGNLDKPETFNEKIAWLKIHGDNDFRTRLADKYLVREYVSERIGEQYLIPLYAVWNNLDEMDFSILPNKFVIKVNDGCGFNYLCHNKDEIDYAKLKKTIKKWMQESFGYVTFEPQYFNIQKKIIAEKLEEEKGKISLTDYKFYCFNGIPKFIHMVCDRDEETGLYKAAFYDLNWNVMNFNYVEHQAEENIEKPKSLNEMIDVATKLSEGIPFVRVDLYEIDGNVKFGEMTFTPLGGYCNWKPNGTNMMLGRMIELTEN